MMPRLNQGAAAIYIAITGNVFLVLSVECLAIESAFKTKNISKYSKNASEQLDSSGEHVTEFTQDIDIFYKHYSDWTDWNRCSKHCFQSRTRKCKTKQYCNHSLVKERRPCRRKRRHCPLSLSVIYGSKKNHRRIENLLYDLFYKAWTSWTPCSTTCRRHRRRKCEAASICGGGYLEESAYCTPKEQIRCRELYTFERIPHQNKTKDVASKGKVPGDYLSVICGYQPVQGSYRIIGGTEAQPHSWPWQVLLLNKRGKPFCGGTLISPTWVLTAAHCIRKKGRQRKVVVRVGEHDISKSEGTERDIKVLQDYPHPDFDYKTIINDIALLKLASAVVSSNITGYACLPIKGQAMHRRKLCKTVGWGKTMMTNIKGSNILQEADIPVIKKKKCRKSFDFTITNTQLCAGYKEGGIDSCTGDSGGPLLCPLATKNSTKWYVTGVTSYGEECGQKGKYGIYTNVVRYLKWIKKVMKE